MSRNPLLRLLLCLLLLLPGLAACQKESGTVTVHIAAINDFHGQMESTTFNPLKAAHHYGPASQAGGIGPLSGLLARLRQMDPELLLVGSGDLIGASPPLSALWADEPALEAMDLIGLRLSAIGNHELDQGRTELLRQIGGGCDSPRPEQACQFRTPYPGTRFTYLSANLLNQSTGHPEFMPYQIEEARGTRIAFIGATLDEIASHVRASSLTGLQPINEAAAINAQIPALQALGVDAMVAVIHQGGLFAPDQRPDCQQLRGPLLDIIRQLDRKIRIVITGHTHLGYACQLDGRLVTQAGSAGQLLSWLTLHIDRIHHQLLDVRAENLLVDPHQYPATPEISALLDTLRQRSQAQLARPIAQLGAARISRAPNRAGESALGDLVAEAQYQMTRPLGAQGAMVNPGSLRADLQPDQPAGPIRYGQLLAAQPFANPLSIATLSGRQLYQLLEQQWQQDGSFTPLQLSSSLNYQWQTSLPHVIPGSLQLDGQSVLNDQHYRITVNAFLAQGGDHFSLLPETVQQKAGFTDLDALEHYLQQQEQAGQPAGRTDPASRILRRS